MENTKIEWADHTINFFLGCTKVSEGCANCYMYRLESRWGRDPTKVRKTNWSTIEANLRKWTPSRIFVNSMSDTFHKDISDADIYEMFHIMYENPKHTFIVLTKRIERAVQWLQGSNVGDHIWIGTSIESQKYLWRMEELKKINAKTHFISFEPLVGIMPNNLNLRGIQWVIVGGESGSNARPMKEEYVDNIFNECQDKQIPFFFKQWGKGLSKCKCHNAFGCRLYKGATWDEIPILNEVKSNNENIIHCCSECNYKEDIKKPKNLASDGIWECPKCGHPHTADEFMEYKI